MSKAAGIRAGRAYVELGTNDSKLKAGLESAQRRLGAFGSTLTKIGGGLIGAGAGVLGLLSGPVMLAANLEQTSAAFETMVGSAEGAKKLMADLQAFAASTPFQFDELADASKKLLAFGSSASEIPSELQKIGDISSAIGAPIGEIAEIFGKAKVQGSLFAEDINQLVGRGIPVIQEFAKQLGVSEGEVKKMASEGKISFSHLNTAFNDLTKSGGKFHGMMDKQSKTTIGKFSTMKDGLVALLRPIGEALLPVVNMVMDQVSQVMGVVAKLISQYSSLVVPIATVAAGLVAAGVVIVSIGTMFLTSAAAIAGVVSVLGTLSGIAAAILSPIGVLVALVVGLGAAFFYFTDAGSQTISWFGTEFQKLTQIVTETVGGMYAALSAGNLGLAAEIAFTGVKLAIATVMESVLALFGTNIKDMMAMLADVIKAVGQVVSRINAARQKAVNWLSDSIASLGIGSAEDERGRRLEEQRKKLLGENYTANDTSMNSQLDKIQQEDLDAATKAAEAWDNWDASKAGEGWAKEFNSDELKAKLDELNATAKEELKAVETRELELREASQKAFEAPTVATNQIKTGMDEKRDTFSTFNGALLAMNSSIPEKQLTVMQRTLDAVKNVGKEVGKELRAQGKATA